LGRFRTDAAAPSFRGAYYRLPNVDVADPDGDHLWWRARGLLDLLGEDNVMWGSDFPHPDGVWPDSQSFIEDELGHLPKDIQEKVICSNAVQLYGFGS
jgi:predicted TIM-barrel fold metal-dependent hydrolase